MRRSTRAAIVILGLGAVTAGVTTIPGDDPPAPEATPPMVAEDPVPMAEIRSSTRGAVGVPVEAARLGGVPHDPGGQAAAAQSMTEASPVAAGESTAAGPAESAESVIGADGRIWFRGRTTRYPNSAIGRIDMRQGGRNYWCTGTLIDADTVLTAGHCVHDGLNGDDGWSTQVEFTPGAEGGRAPFGSCRSRELLALPGWVDRGAEYQDLGLVQLDCAIGETVGWFGYRTAPGPRGLRNAVAHIRGYPGDKVWSSLWSMRDRIRVSQAQMAFYAADTYGGQSGSPVFSWRRCNGASGPCIMAVHAYGTHPRGPHRNHNHGPRINDQRAALIGALAAG